LDPAPDQPEPRGAAELGRRVEEQLESEADAQRGDARGQPLGDEPVEAELRHPLHRLRECADPRQDDSLGLADGGVVAGDLHRGAHVLERLLDGPEVAHPVVEDGDHRSPFVDGTPASVASSAIARRSARAKALNAASITWWSLPPASTRTCNVNFAVEATARRNSRSSP